MHFVRTISMNLNSDLLRAAAVALCLVFPAMGNAESMTFTGSASTSSTQVQMPLANGATVVTANATGIAAMTGESAPIPILLELRCSGLGYAMDDSDGSTELYCTFMENDVDQFDIKGSEKSGETTITVIGGSGRWAKATGSGTLKRVSTSENSSRSTFELTINTP